jgi:16S rRNA (cytidine1402-2'-O)-methyltransferase
MDIKPVSVGVETLSIERPAVYVVATPIGNLADIGARAIAVLGSVDRILCEDTRHSRRLLDHYGIDTPLSALHEHNERGVAAQFVERLRERGECCALISDAGTPLISDPGYVLVADAIAAGVPIISVPGPCALVAALAISGLPTDRFAFEGFLPSAAGTRAARLEALAREPRTLIFYEAPHRLLASIAAMAEVFGTDRDAVIVRELSKRFETVYRGPLGPLGDRLAADPNATRGEMVILVAGAPETALAQQTVDRTLEILLADTDRKTAVRLAAALTGLGRNALYRRSLELRPDSD